MPKEYRVRVVVTHRFTEEGLRGLWAYHRWGVPFSFTGALALARSVMSDNPEVEIQISEGINRLSNTEAGEE